MKLIPNSHDKMIHVSRRYLDLKARFDGFFNGAQYLLDPSSKIVNLAFDTALEKDYFDVLFTGMQIRFKFIPFALEDGSLHGSVYCLRESPRFIESKDIIANFTFNGRGITNFEVDEGSDALEIEYNAGDIIMHFVNQALAKPLV
jgi:hypothetical protein